MTKEISKVAFTMECSWDAKIIDDLDCAMSLIGFKQFGTKSSPVEGFIVDYIRK